jgi:hypothetical protein
LHRKFCRLLAFDLGGPFAVAFLAQKLLDSFADWDPNDDQPYTMTVGGDKTIRVIAVQL